MLQIRSSGVDRRTGRERRRRVGHDQHVAFLDLLEAPDRRAVEAEPSVNAVGIECPEGTEKCCHVPGKSVKRRSTIRTSLSLMDLRTSSTVPQLRNIKVTPIRLRSTMGRDFKRGAEYTISA